MRAISPHVTICAFLAIALQSNLACWAGPTDKAPDALLEVRPERSSTQLIMQAAQLYPAAAKEVAQHEVNLAAKRYDKASKRDMESIADTSLKIFRLRRVGERLVELREPAGLDLEHRYNALAFRLSHVIGTYKKSENAVPLIQQAGKTMSAVATRNKNSLTRISALVERDKLEAAERELDEIHDDLYLPAVFLSRPEADRNFAPFKPLLAEVQVKTKDRRTQQADEAIAARRAKETPNYDAIAKLVNTAVEDAKDDGLADWVGKSLDGPALIDAWADGWRRTGVKMLQCYALDRLREIPQGAQPPSDIDQLLAAHAKFEQQMLSAMAALIEADAARVDPGAAPQLYTSYLPAVARLCASSADERIEQSLVSALNELAQRSPDFAQQVAAYESATREALRWRGRLASAYARRHERQSQAVSDLLIKASSNDALKNRPMNSIADVSQLTGAAPPLVQDVAEVAVKQKAYARDISPQTDGPSASRFAMYYFSRVPVTPIPPAEVAALKHDLLVTESNPPLTLAAAMAIESAQAGYLVAAGGDVSGVELDTLLVHFVGNESTAHLPIGVRPDMSKATMKSMCWQVDVQPSWFQHEYVFFTAP